MAGKVRYYTITDERGNVMLENATRKEITKHFGLSESFNPMRCVEGSSKMCGEYTVSIADTEEAIKAKEPGMVGRNRSFTPEMLAEWKCMNRRYGKRFK